MQGQHFYGHCCVWIIHFGSASGEQIQCPVWNNLGESSHKPGRSASFSHLIFIWSRSRKVEGGRSSLSVRGGVTESAMLCCLLDCWPVTTRGVSHVLSAAGWRIVDGASLPSKTRGIRLQVLSTDTAADIYACVWVSVACGEGGRRMFGLWFAQWEHSDYCEMCKVMQRLDSSAAAAAGTLAVEATCCWLQVT